MSREFDDFYDNGCLGKKILAKGGPRSLKKEECRAIYKYFQERQPKIVFEFGVQYGASTRAFIEMSKWLNLNLTLHSWDIVKGFTYIKETDFNFHLDNVVGREEVEFDKYNPNFVFLDAHPYQITKNIMEICLKRKIDFMLHDVSYHIGMERTSERTKGFTDTSLETNANWELYLLGTMVSTRLWREDSYEDDNLEVECIRASCGIAIVRFKR